LSRDKSWAKITMKDVKTIFMMFCSAIALGSSWAISAEIPRKIESLVSPKIFQEVMNDRRIEALGHLENHHYLVHAVMLVKASLTQTRATLTHYDLYAQMIPYIDRSDYMAPEHLLWVEGGVWKFRISSWLKFEEKSPEWIHFRITRGHFAGMTGDIYFENRGEKGTLVYFGGEQTASDFPPKFIIERGAEIVFGFTASRMRSYIESLKHKEFEKNDDSSTPRPRSHL